MRLTFEIQSKITLPLQPQIQDLTLSQLSQTTHDFKITQITCCGRENKKQLSLTEGKRNFGSKFVHETKRNVSTLQKFATRQQALKDSERRTIHWMIKILLPLHEHLIIDLSLSVPFLLVFLITFHTPQLNVNTSEQFPDDARYGGPQTGLACSGVYMLLSWRPPYAQRSKFRK